MVLYELRNTSIYYGYTRMNAHSFTIITYLNGFIYPDITTVNEFGIIYPGISMLNGSVFI